MDERAVRVCAVAAVASATAALWWSLMPRTPEALFRLRCSSCHALPDLCRYAPDQRAGIVSAMRTRRGADQVIDEFEAHAISRYLGEEMPCR